MELCLPCALAIAQISAIASIPLMQSCWRRMRVVIAPLRGSLKKMSWMYSCLTEHFGHYRQEQCNTYLLACIQKHKSYVLYSPRIGRFSFWAETFARLTLRWWVSFPSLPCLATRRNWKSDWSSERVNISLRRYFCSDNYTTPMYCTMGAKPHIRRRPWCWVHPEIHFMSVYADWLYKVTNLELY